MMDIVPTNLHVPVSSTELYAGDSNSDDRSTEYEEGLLETGTSGILRGVGGGVWWEEAQEGVGNMDIVILHSFY